LEEAPLAVEKAKKIIRTNRIITIRSKSGIRVSEMEAAQIKNYGKIIYKKRRRTSKA
jgi:hypothetical protein